MIPKRENGIIELDGQVLRDNKAKNKIIIMKGLM